MTINDWCKLNGVSTSTMYRWMAVFREEEPGLFGGRSSSGWSEVTRGSITKRTALATKEEAVAVFGR